jgi:hypothetical protein
MRPERRTIQTADDKRRFGVTNRWTAGIATAVGVPLLLWLLLFLVYRQDRPDAANVAALSVLLIAPPVASYLAVMHVTRGLAALWVRVLLVYLAALAWLLAQRFLLYPWLGFDVSIGESFTNFLLLPALGIAVWLGGQAVAYRHRLERALALQQDTERRLLELQLAPHMLFNMLNTVYAALLTDREAAAGLLLAMSQALRHLTGGERRSWLPLAEELAFVENCSALERARHPASRIGIVAEGDTDAPVVPMLLATLFENALKHGRLEDGAVDIDVRASAGDTEILLQVSNRIPRAPSLAEAPGLGLANLRRRLDLAYGPRGTLRLERTDGVHVATVAIAL